MQETAADAAPINFLTGLFFVSGFASLVYQVSWQRVLFAAFGSDLESVTIVVSAFMLGLGGGALFGGWLADRAPMKTLALFCACEAGIGLYGLISFDLMHWVGDVFVLAGMPVIAAVNFLLILAPTLLMGATLPILVAHTVRQWGNVGKATGHLYGANTLGAALGAVTTVFGLFLWMRLDGSIRLAAAMNFAIVVLGFWRLRHAR